MEAYFESRSVMAEWNRYSNAVTEFYDITACRPPSMSESSASKKIEVMRRSRRLKDVLSTVIQVAEGQNARGAYRRDMAALAECALPLSGTPVYEQAWFDVRNRILDHNDKLVQIIFKSPIPAYTNIWDRITDVWDRVTNL